MPTAPRKGKHRPGGVSAIAWAAKTAAEAPPREEGPGVGFTKAAPITLPRVGILEEPETE